MIVCISDRESHVCEHAEMWLSYYAGGDSDDDAWLDHGDMKIKREDHECSRKMGHVSDEAYGTAFLHANILNRYVSTIAD